MLKQSVRILFSLSGATLYIAGCMWWAGRGTIANVWLAEALWAALAIAVALVWGLKPVELVTVVAGASLMVLSLSQEDVDFPPNWFERLPIISQWIIMLIPLLLAMMIGVALRRKGIQAAGLALSLSSIGVLPQQIWNVQTRMEGGWQEWPYPAHLPWSAFVTMVAGFFIGAGMGWLGYRLRERFSPGGKLDRS